MKAGSGKDGNPAMGMFLFIVAERVGRLKQTLL